MKILFRVDAGGGVGLGHYFRSVSLARRLQESGHTVIFSFLESAFWSERILEGFDFAIEPLQGAESEIQTCLCIESCSVDLFYVDANLDFSDGVIERLQLSCKVVFYQNMSPSAVRADVFIYPSVRKNSDFFSRLKNSGALVYRGLDYILFHPDIAQIPKKIRASRALRTVAVSAGGSDPKNTLVYIYSIIRAGGFEKFKFVFFYGSDYAFKTDIPRNCPPNVTFQEFDHTAILKADVLITAFGVSAYEFLYLGIPVIAYGHQPSNAITLEELAQATGALVNLGEVGNIDRESLGNTLERLSQSNTRRKIVERARKVIDTKGVVRVTAILEAAYSPTRELDGTK